jgi:hypothetical protein
MRRFTLFLCVLALCVAGPAAAVTGGAFDGTAHPYVGMATNGGTICSGTLVAPTVFITAAHCFSGQASVLGNDANGNAIVGVGFDPAPTKLTLRGSVYNDPQYCAGCAPGTAGVEVHDLAVVILTTAQPGPYASLPTLNLAESLRRHALVTIVGYGAVGFDGKGKKAAPIELHQRYAGDAELGNAGGKIADSFITLSGHGSNATPCFGDSGGPDLLAGTSTMIGITSWGKGNTCNGASFSYRVDTQDSLSFISGVVAAHA